MSDVDCSIMMMRVAATLGSHAAPHLLEQQEKRLINVTNAPDGVHRRARHKLLISVT